MADSLSDVISMANYKMPERIRRNCSRSFQLQIKSVFRRTCDRALCTSFNRLHDLADEFLKTKLAEDARSVRLVRGEFARTIAEGACYEEVRHYGLVSCAIAGCLSPVLVTFAQDLTPTPQTAGQPVAITAGRLSSPAQTFLLLKKSGRNRSIPIAGTISTGSACAVPLTLFRSCPRLQDRRSMKT